MSERMGDRDPAVEMYSALSFLGASTKPVEPTTLHQEMVRRYWDFQDTDFQTGFQRLLVYGILSLTLEGNLNLYGEIEQLGNPGFFLAG